MKRRTVTDRALNPDLASMHLHDLFNDREAEASPGNRLGGSAADAAEALEHVADLVWWDSNPGIGNADKGKSAFGAARQGDGPAVRLSDGERSHRRTDGVRTRQRIQ